MAYTHTGAQTFTKAITYKLEQRNIIAFTVSKEANVRYYNIEAANDTGSFETIAKVRSLGNTVIPREYRYDITGHDQKYYRITEVLMNWQNEYSAIIPAAATPVNTPRTEHIPAASQIAIVKNLQQ